MERIYVHSSLYDSFVALFVQRQSLWFWDPLNNNTFIGPLARKEQIKVIQIQVNDAIEKGANLLLGGKVWKGQVIIICQL